MHLSGPDYLAAAAAAAAAGVINALAGGGTLISFPTLVGLGVPAVDANVTNTVALVPGYLGGSWAQRDELVPQLEHARLLASVSVAGALAGSVLLVTIPGHAFRVAIPYLIVLSCLLLLGQDRIREIVLRNESSRSAHQPEISIESKPETSPGVDAAPGTGAVAPERSASTRHEGGPQMRPTLLISVFAAAVYGGFFGAGLGIMLLAILGVFTTASLIKSNALKQALSFVINLVAGVFFAFSGHVQWALVPVMAAGSIAGGIAGGRLVNRISGDLLRRLVVFAGFGIAVGFWVV